MSIPANLIINADDFGATHLKNVAISKCFVSGIINSTSIMANMESFIEAVSMSKEYGFANKIGLHANLTEGKPLTDLSGSKLVNKEGFFINANADKKLVYLSADERSRVKAEIEAQLNRLYSNNIKPAHINSHHHAHTLPWLASAFLEVAKKFNIKIRIAQTWNKNNNILVPLYRNLLNRTYKRNRLNFTDRFETFESYAEMQKNNSTNSVMTEIMVHPDLNANNNIYDSYDGSNLEEKIKANILLKNYLPGNTSEL